MRRAVWVWCSLLLVTAVGAEPLPRIGVGGYLRMGLGGTLLRAGLPFDYLTLAEQADPAVLARYDAILQAPLTANDDGWCDRVNRALEAYVKQGGHLYTALHCRPPEALAGLGWHEIGTGHPPSGTGWPFQLVAGDHPLLRRFAPEQRWDYGYTLFALRPTPQDTVLARFAVGDGRAAALVARRVGQGEVLYSGFDVSYLQGNWAPRYEDLILGLAHYLTAGRATPVWSRSPAPAAAVLAAAPPDDRVGPYTVGRLRWPATGRATLQVGWREARPDALHLVGDPRAVTVTVRRAGRPQPPRRVALPGGEALLLVAPERCDLVAGGRVLLSVPGRYGGEAVWHGPGEAVWQSNADGLCGADFAAEGELSSDWTTVEGEWRLTGRGEGKGQPGFALRGRDGLVRAGRWYWAGTRCEVAVRPLEATAVRLQVARDDAGGALEAVLAVDSGTSRLVRRSGAAETVLAATERHLPQRQWTRVEVRADWRLAKLLIDGEPWLQATDPGPQCGAIALGVRGEALFDDVRVACGTDAWPVPEVHSAGLDKGPEGLLDRDTWSHPAAAWEPGPERALQWHVGRFAGDLELRLRPGRWAAGGQVTLHAGAERGKRAPTVVWSTAAGELVARRRGGRWSVAAPGRLLAQPAGSVCLGLEWQGVELAAEDLHLVAADVTETTFDRAPVDWRVGEGHWTVASRWTCEPEWAWLVGDGHDGRAALWHKWPLVGDVVLHAPLGVQMTGSYGSADSEPVERLRLTLAGDGRDPSQGYVLEVGAGGPHLALRRHGQEVARVRDVVPHWREAHNAWVDVRVERHGATLTAWVHRRRVLTWTDPVPLPDGQAALGTERNRVVLPYVAVYGRRGPALEQ